ncbi:MAG: DUF2066 domain-containing protein [Magnetococcales bacterium]|nr:DUF2066 domain-containing protein [Magnetococcales bacterium]
MVNRQPIFKLLQTNRAALLGISLLLFGLFSLPSPAQASVFEVKEIEIEIPLQGANNQDPRKVGLARAESKAFTLLFNRMLTQANQEYNRDFLQTLRREKGKLIERSVVRSERRRLRTFQMTVDVFFSKEAVSEAFARAGLSHGESLYPQTLLVVKADTQTNLNGFQYAIGQTAQAYGISLSHPLGDMDDMVNLTWENIAASSPTFQSWVDSRYGIKQIWAVFVKMESRDGGPGQPSYYTASAQLLEKSPQTGQNAIQSSLAGHFDSPRQAQASLFPAIAQQLLQQLSDQWISQHSVEPTLRHHVSLRIVHHFNYLKYEKFLHSLQVIPGISGMSYQTIRAREVVIDIDYLGSDNTLFSAITRLGVQVQSDVGGMVVHIL